MTTTTTILLSPQLRARIDAEIAAREARGIRATLAGLVREALDGLLPPAPAPQDDRQERLPGLDGTGGDR